jgi:uncharacterized protein (TIGR02599 family)
MMTLISSILSQVMKAWQNTTGKIEGFRDARSAFETVTRTISQATLNTYYDYVNANGQFRGANDTAFQPDHYARQSDLQIVSGPAGTLLSSGLGAYTATGHAIFFFSPLGIIANADTSTTSSTGLGRTSDGLNVCGFYVLYGADPTIPSFLSSIPTRYRYRLMQLVQPTEYLSIFAPGSGANGTGYGTSAWFLNAVTGDIGATTPVSNSVLAENVVALILLPKLAARDETAGGYNDASLAPAYSYDSSTVGAGKPQLSNGEATTPALSSMNQLPPDILVTMVVIDEASAVKLGNTTSPPALSKGAPFTDATQLTTDLATLENNLGAISGNAAGNRIPLKFRVFQSEVAVQGAKWSSQ